MEKAYLERLDNVVEILRKNKNKKDDRIIDGKKSAYLLTNKMFVDSLSRFRKSVFELEDITDERERENFTEALNLVYSRTWSIFDVDYIKELHQVLSKGILSEEKSGEFRKGFAKPKLTKRFYVQPSEIETRLECLVQYLARCSLDVCVMTMIFFEFLSIHPFSDFNGRLAHLLLIILLSNHVRLPLAIWDRKKYLEIIEECYSYEKNTPIPLYKLIVESYYSQLFR